MGLLPVSDRMWGILSGCQEDGQLQRREEVGRGKWAGDGERWAGDGEREAGGSGQWMGSGERWAREKSRATAHTMESSVCPGSQHRALFMRTGRQKAKHFLFRQGCYSVVPAHWRRIEVNLFLLQTLTMDTL